MTKEQYNFSAFKALASQAMAYKNHPTKRLEEWRYSDFTLLDRPIICAVVQAEDGLPRSVAPRNDGGMDVPTTRHCERSAAIHLSLDATSYYVVLVNGALDTNRLNLPTEGVAIRSTDSRDFWAEVSKLNLQNGFDSKYQVLQNYSKITSGLLIDISTTLDRPLKIYYLNTSDSNQVAIIKIKDGAQVKFYEEFVQQGPLINHVTKLELGDNSQCKHFKQHNFTDDVRFLYSSKVICKAGAQYQNYTLNFGCQSYRQDVEAELQGPMASCNFYGANIGKEQQIYDVILNVKHQSSHTSSSQHYNQILADKSKGSFYSKVEIPKALNTLVAHQLNKNLLLDEQAQAFSRPELDIHSDDVACSHGATVGHVDAEALDYLKSRGLDPAAAEKLILQGFLKSVFEDKGLDEEDYRAISYQILEHIN